MTIESVKHVLLVLSGKGGVGKSSVAAQLAITLHQLGHSVGILDIDLCGPTIPTLFGVDNETIYQSPEGWVPIQKDSRLKIMSIGFLLKTKADAVIWRGPKKNALIKQFLQNVNWGNLDYLIVDTPPGTSDEHISVVQLLADSPSVSSILVTTPQAVALNDVKKEYNFCQRVGLRVLGLLENMSGYACPHCSECTNIFSSGGGRFLAEQFDCPFLGTLPVDPYMCRCSETGLLLEKYNECPSAPLMKKVINAIVMNESLNTTPIMDVMN